MAKEGSEAGEMEAAGRSEESILYEKKFKEMQSYIPFLEMMIGRLEQNGDKSRQAQLEKMKSLHSILSSTKKKLKLEILQRCEEVLQKLKAKVDKGTGKEKSASPKQKNVDNKNTVNKSTSSSNKKEDGPSRKKKEPDVQSPASGEKSVNVIMTLAARSKVVPLSGERNTDVKSKGGETKANEIQDSKATEVQDSSDSLADDLDISALIRSRERLKSLLRKQDSLSSPQKSGERLNSPSQWNKNSGASLLDEQELKQISKHIIQRSDSWNRKHSEEESFSSKIRVHSNDLYPEQGGLKSPSMWSPEISSNSFNNINLNSLAAGPLNISSSSLHSPPGTFSHSSGLLSPVRQPQKKTLPVIPPLLNVLQFPPVSGSKPLSEADLEELMEDTINPENDRNAKEPKKKEESKVRSLRAKLEEEIQQVHRVGISKGGALRGLKKVDDIVKSPVRNKGDSKTEVKKDKSPTISENSSGRKSDDAGLLSPSRRSSGNEMKNKSEECVTVKTSERVLDPRKKGDRDDGSVGNAVENRDPRLKSAASLETNTSKDRNVVSVLQDSVKNKGSILSSLSTQDLQKIVEKNLNNLPLPPPELMENLSLNASAINKSSWQQSADMSCLSPREFQHQDVHGSGHYGAHFDPSRATPVPYPRSNTSYNPGYSNIRAEDSPLLKPEDPRLKPRTHIPDPRCNSGRDYQNQGLIPSSPYQDSVLRSPAPHIEGFGSGVLPHPTAHGLRPNGQDLPQPENYGGGLLPPPASHTTRVVGQEFTRSANPYHTSHQLYQGNQTGSIPSQSRWAGTSCYGVPSHGTRRAEENFGIRNTPSNVHPAYTAPAIRRDHGFQFMGQSRPAHETYTVPKQPPWPGPSVHGSTRNPLPVSYPSSGRPIGLSSVQQQQPTTKPGVVDARISCTGSGNIQLPINRAPVSNVSTQNSYSGINSREGKISDRDPRRRNSEDHEKGSSRSKERKVSDSKTTSTRRSVESKRFNERRERESNRRDSTEPNKVKDKETELVSPLNSLYGSTATPRTGKGYGLQKFRIPKIKRDLPKEPSPPPSTLPPSTNEDVGIQAESEIKGEVKEKGKPDCDVRAEAAMDSGAEGKSSDLKPKEEVTQEWIEALIKKSFECGEAKKCIEQAKLLEKLGESLKGKKLKKIQRILESDSDTNSEEEESNKQVQENTVENKTKASLESHKHKKRSHHRIVISDDESEDDKSKKEKDAPRNEGSDKETAELSETNQNNKLGSDAQGDTPDSTPKGEKPVKRYSKRRSALELLQEDIREMFICEGVVTATGHRMCRLLKEAPSDINVNDIVESATRYQDEASTTAGDSDTSSVVSKKHSRKFKDKKFTKKRSETKSTKKSKGKGKPVNDTSNVISAVKEDTLSKAQLSNAEDSSSPVIKSRKKSKWKGYVMESDDSNNDDDDAIPHVEENKDTKESVEKLEDEDIPLQDILLTRTAKAKLLNKYEENNQHSTNFKTEFGRRTRLPRVVIEKTDISKIEYTSKPQISYAEETSDEDISSIKDYASSETEFKAKEKSKQSARRGRRRTGGKGHKKAQKHKPNTTIEQNTMQSKFVQETLGTDFLYRKKGKRKRSYFLGKKISDVVERLTLRAQSVRVESALQESASLESIKPEASKTNIPSDGILKQANEPDEVTEETAYSGMDKISNVKTENVELQDEADVKTTRITLNLIRKTSMQKKTKKKKAKWQLGIINHSKKKSGTRSKFDENKYTGSGKKMTVNDSEVKFETENSAKKELDKQNVKLENEANGTINGSVPKETNIKMNNSEEDTEIQICDSENQNNELISSNVNEIATDVNYTNKGYAFDGSMKYPCKLCPIKCRHIVFHYKTAHADSEVLISRLPELEAEIAIADSKENDYKEVEQEVSKIKIKRRTKKNQRVFCCRICNQICSFAVNFYDHLTSHTGEYRFKCGKCDFKATTRMRVKSHFYSQHPEYKGIESVSTEILAEGPSMDSKYILGYLCSSCNFVQLLRSNLEKHIDLRHNKDAEKAEIICINMSKVKDALERTKGSNESAHTAVEPKQELAKDVQSNSVINSSDRELIVEEDNSKATIFDSNNLGAYHSEKMEGSIVNESAIADDVAELKELSQGEDKTTIGDKAVESDLICVGIKSHENECSSKNCTESNIGPENCSNHTESKTPSNDGINIEESADLIGQNMSTNSKIKAEVTDKHCTSTSETIPVTHEKPNEVDEKIFVYPDDVENDDDGKFDQMKRISDNLNGKPSSFPSGCDVLQRLLDSLISENEAASMLEQENNLKEPTIEEEKESPKSETEVVQAVETLLKDMEPEIPTDSNLLNKELGTSPSSVPDKGTETKSKESELNLCALSKRTEENPSLPLEDEEADIVNLSDTNETNANQENNSNILQRILTRDMENKVDSADTKTPKIISVYSKADGESSEIFSDGIEGSENEDDSSYNECIDPQMEKESDLLDEAKTILNTADPLHRMVEIIENLISVLSPEQEAEPKEKNQEDKQDTAMETADYSIKPNFNVMPKALPLIAIEAKEIMARRGTIDKVESSTAFIRMGPIIVRYIEGNILYSCCLRGCVFATTKQAKFANHLDTIHKNVRWDGKCKGCLDAGFSKHYHKIKLLEALQHVIEHHVPDLANKCKAISAEEHLATTASNNTALPTASDKEQQSAFTNNKPAESTLPAAEEEARNIAAAEPPRQLIRIRRLSGDILSATNKNSVGNQELPSSEIGSENSSMVSTEEGTDQTEGGELSIKIANVISLNPDAIGSGDVDMFNTGDDESSTPERSDSVEMDMSRTPPDVTSPNPGISPIRTASVSNKGLVSPTKAKVLKCTSSYQMCMMPEASLPTSTITVLPTVSKVSSIKVNKLSPVKLANITPKEFSASGPVSSSFPRSVLSLTRVTQASEIQMARSLLKSKRLNTAAPPLVRVKIADGKKAILPNSMTYLAPTKMSVPASSSFNTSLMEPSLPLSLVTTTVLEPLSNTPLGKTSMLEPSLQSTTLPDSPVLEPSLQTSTLSGSSVLQPSLQSKTTADSSVPESSSLLDSSSRIAKTKTAHKSAVAPSYAKASKVPLYYQEMLTHTKLRHLFKCMAKQCSYTTDNEKLFKEHFTEHSKSNKGSSVKRNRVPGCKYDWQQCVYCCAMFAFAEKLVEHIVQEHGNCLYQCSYCFFRAICASYIVLHQNTCHINEKVMVLFCNRLQCVPEAVEEEISREERVLPYICQQGSCGEMFYRSDDFQNHLDKEHSQLTIYSCHMCASILFRADRLVAHYKLHSCCYYQCIYCNYGSDTKEEMQHHLCNTHPNKLPKIITRSLDESMAGNELLDPSTRMLDMLKVMDLEEDVSGDLIIHPGVESDEGKENGGASPLISNSQKGALGAEEELTEHLSPFCTDIPIDKEQEKEMDKSGTQLSDNSIQDTVGNKASGDTINEGRTDVNKELTREDILILDENKAVSQTDKACKSKPENNAIIRGEGTQNQDAEVIVLDSSTEDEGPVIQGDLNKKKSEIPELILPEPLVTLKHRNPETRTAIQAAVDPLSIPDTIQNETGDDVSVAFSDSVSRVESDVDDKCSSQQRPEPCESSSDATKTGFSGCALYRCGYSSCTYSAETSSLLKDHLCTCDMARDSPSLICVHCRKQFKHVGTLMEHLRTHGTNRFKCSLCGYLAPVPHQVAKHLKQKHRVTSTKVVPLNPLESDPETANFVVVPKERLKGKKPKAMSKEPLDSSNKRVFLPEELEQLPPQAIFTVPLECATCKYETKVRSNLYRHLQLHTLSTDEPITTIAAISAEPTVLPSSAPVNPVPCLETNEMMFDKMTNLALSSHMGNLTKVGDGSSGNSKMAEDMEAKLPKFVPEKLRYVCGAPNCNYLTVDDTMLRYHLRALHFDQTSYRCPHCPEAQDSNFHIPIERMGAHLKMHDSRLYKCAYCMYNHFQRHVVERHLADKHPEKRPYVHVVREPETEASKVDDTTAILLDSNAAEATEAVKNPWHCGLCKHQSATRADILDHTWTVHGIKSQYKCGLCTFRSSSRSSVDTHSLAKHPDSTVEMVHVYRKVEAPKVKSPFKNSTSQEGTAIDAHPVWRRDDSKLRHIRGIFLDDEVQTSTPVKQSYKLEENAGGGDEKYGQYGEPFGDNFVCPRCLKYRSKYRADFRDHLYRELQYKKWICTHCNLTSCNRNTVMKHSSKVHEKEGKLESIVALPADEEIEAWVKNVINTQSYIMKHGSSSGLPSAESLSTEPETSSKQKLLDKPDTKEVKKSEEGVLKMDDEKSIDEESISSAQPSSQKETRERRYECKRCGDKFSLRRGLKLHIRINHLKLGKWMCAYCDYVTNSEIMLSKHSKVRHPELPQKCLPNNRGSTEILDDAFWEREFGLDSETETSRSAVTQKRKASVREDESSEDGTIKCQECDYSCCSPKDMKQHMIKHWVQKPFKCGYCDFEGVSEYDIKKHSAKMHPMKTFRIIEGSGAGRAEIRHFNKRYKSKASRSDADGSDDEINKDDSNGEEINEEYLMYRCYYCPQRGTAIAVIHQHWEEKHKNGSITSNGIVRCGLPFKYKEVNLRQYIKGEDNAAGRRPLLQCTYCEFRGNYALLEVHHRSMHFDKQFKINRTSSTRYECAVCHFAAFTVNTLKRHFDMEHAGEEFRYIVRTAEEALGSTSSGSSKTLDRSSPLPISNMEVTKYMCLWCEKTYDSELKIQSHHSSHHSSLQLKYSVEKISAPSQIKGNFIPPKRYQCPCCSFSSNNYTSMGEHLRHHVKSFVCGYCKERYESPGKLRLHVQQFHPGCKYKAEYSSDSEAELAVLKSDILINASDAVSEPVRTPAKRENSGDRLGSAPKKLCVARKSTGSIQGKKLNAVARKSTTYLPWQRSPSTSPSPPSSDPSDVEDNVDQESLTSTSSKTDTQADGFSFYGRSPSPVDTNKITAYVKFKKGGSGMNMNVATMERIANLYPKVRVRKLVLF